jgi:hypothetical protein
MDRLKEASTEQRNSGWNYNFNQLVDIKNKVRQMHGVLVREEEIDVLIDVLVKLKYITLTRETIPA